MNKHSFEMDSHDVTSDDEMAYEAADAAAEAETHGSPLTSDEVTKALGATWQNAVLVKVHGTGVVELTYKLVRSSRSWELEDITDICKVLRGRGIPADHMYGNTIFCGPGRLS